MLNVFVKFCLSLWLVFICSVFVLFIIVLSDIVVVVFVKRSCMVLWFIIMGMVSIFIMKFL